MSNYSCRRCHKVVNSDYHSHFYLRSKNDTGLDDVCKECRRREANERNYRDKYGITIQEAVDAWNSQGCRCMTCLNEIPEPPNRNSVADHCHSSGNFRAILCDNCNKALGMVNDDPGTLARMVAYLNFHHNTG